MTFMSKFEMEFYTVATGVAFSVTWKDEDEYRLATAFLDDLIGGPIRRHDPNKPAFYYFETQQQDALFRFQRELRKRRQQEQA
jgi:hypothetical protein